MEKTIEIKLDLWYNLIIKYERRITMYLSLSIRNDEKFRIEIGEELKFYTGIKRNYIRPITKERFQRDFQLYKNSPVRFTGIVTYMEGDQIKKLSPITEEAYKLVQDLLAFDNILTSLAGHPDALYHDLETVHRTEEPSPEMDLWMAIIKLHQAK